MPPSIEHASQLSLTAHWQRFLTSSLGKGAHASPPPAFPAGTPDPAQEAIGRDRQIEVSELFVQADVEERRSLDLLCLALVAYAGDDEPGGVQLHVWGPQQLRAQSRSSLTGVTAVDIQVAPAFGARWVSFAVLRVLRRPRAGQVTGEIVDLAEVLDYKADSLGSDAVARAVLDRVEILTTATGVVVSVAQTVDLTVLDANDDALHLLTAEGVEEIPPDRAPAHAGRLAPTASGRREDDYVILRFGTSRQRRTTQRTLVDLRRQHALVEIGEDPGQVDEAGSYATRVMRARQDARAKNVLQAVEFGDHDAAVEACREALRVRDELETFRESLASRIATPAAFWGVDDVIAAVADAHAAAPAAIAKLRKGLDVRIGQVLSADAPTQDGEGTFPMVTPIVVEVADDLVRHVDADQDGGRFLEELIPWMRGRITSDTGVFMPGVRMRGNPSLPPGAFQVQIDEVKVLDASTFSDGKYRVDRLDRADPVDSARRVNAEETFIHPVTGEHGAWCYVPVFDGADAERMGERDDEGSTFGPPHYLIQKIELTLRSHLAAFLGPAEVDTLVSGWPKVTADGSALEVLDPRARVRLTWVMQSLVEDQIPLRDGAVILRTVGAVTEPLPELRRAARTALRADLPGRGNTDRRVRLPEELETALLAPPEPEMIEDTHRTHLDLLGWLREAADRGPVFTVVTGSPEARELVARIARAHYAFVTTLTVDELP